MLVGRPEVEPGGELVANPINSGEVLVQPNGQLYVAGYMDREYTSLSPDANLAEVLPLMAHTGACALVMEGGRLLGLLTTENLSQFLLLRRFGW